MVSASGFMVVGAREMNRKWISGPCLEGKFRFRNMVATEDQARIENSPQTDARKAGL